MEGCVYNRLPLQEASVNFFSSLKNYLEGGESAVFTWLIATKAKIQGPYQQNYHISTMYRILPEVAKENLNVHLTSIGSENNKEMKKKKTVNSMTVNSSVISSRFQEQKSLWR